MAKKKLSDNDLKALLAAEKADAVASMSANKLSEERTRALDYYNGKMPDMPVATGRSSAVSTDVADTVEGLMPSLLEIFCGGDEVVRFDPVGPEDVQAAEQESDYVNHVFMQQNPGFMILYTFIKDALLSKVGVVKVWTEEYEEKKKETYYDQPEESFMMLASNQDVEIIEHSEQVDPITGISTHDVTVMTKKKVVKHCVENVPPEEFGIARNAKSVADCGYCFHEVARRESEAIGMGFDETEVKKLPTYVTTMDGTEAQARDTVEDSSGAGGDDGANTANRLVKLTEHYVVMDYDGTGARMYRVTTGGDQGDILTRNGKKDIEEVDEPAFAAMSPIIMPHRFFGKSIADLVSDIQRIKTALTRALLDNSYLANNPTQEIVESHAGVNTLDDLLISRPGRIVRTKMPGGLIMHAYPSIANHILPTIEYFDATREWRTGVTRQGQGIDANALQNQSATAVNQAFTAAQARMKLIARIFAETGVRDMFSLLHKAIRKHGSARQTVRLRNQWVTVDPRDWKERNDLTINVGIGDGSKAEKMAETQILIQAQTQAIGAGIVSPKNLWNTAKRLTRLIGEKDVDSFFTPPGRPPDPNDPSSAPIPPPTDPKIEIEKQRIAADMQAKQMDAQMRGQEMQVKAATDAQSDQRKAEIERMQAEADIATNDRKVQADMMLAQQKFEFEKQLKIMDHELKREQHAAEMQMKREQHEQSMAAGAFKVVAGAHAHEQKMEQSKGAE